METRKLRIGICAKQTDDLSSEAEPTVMNVFCEASVTDDGEEITVEYDEYLVEGGGSTHTKLIFKKTKRPGSSFTKKNRKNRQSLRAAVWHRWITTCGWLHL